MKGTAAGGQVWTLRIRPMTVLTAAVVPLLVYSAYTTLKSALVLVASEVSQLQELN